MERIGTVNYHGLTGDTKVKHDHYDAEEGMIHCLIIGNSIRLFPEGRGNESEANLLGFLDQMHSIRNALMQDMAERNEVTA